MEVREPSAKYLVRPGYKQTEVGVIPADWDVITLSSIAKEPMQNGLFFKPSLKGSGVKLINVGDLYARVPIDTGALELFGATDQERERFKVEDGDLLFTRSSVVPSGIAHCNIYRSTNPESVVFDSHVIRLRPDTTRVVASYLFRFCVASVARRYLVSCAKTATMTTIDQGVLGKCPIVLPPHAEQEGIAEALSDADALIESLEQLLAKKRHVKQGAMQELLTGKKRLPGFDGAWEVKQLGEVAHIKTGGRNNQDKVDDGLYPFYVRSEVIERINSYCHDCEAILVPGEGRIGNIFHYINGRFDVHQRVYAINQFTSGTSGKFVYFYMLKNFGFHAMQNTVKATVDSLRLPTFQNFEMLVPPTLEEQTAIATILSDMDTEIAALEAKLSKARQIKQAMMQALLTGRIRLI